MMWNSIAFSHSLNGRLAVLIFAND